MMCDFAAEQNSDSYLVSQNIRRETSVEEAEKGMEKVRKVYREEGRGRICRRGER